MEAWPCQKELDLICSLPVGLSSQLHCGICRPHSSYGGEHAPPIADLLCLPHLEAHPVLFARKLLILGTFLQGVLPTAVKAMEVQGFFPHTIMHRAVDTAVRLVTTKDELLNSVEAIECITLEAMYHNYNGNLHRAWRAIRRAITVAQSMALHRGFTSPSVKFLEQTARQEFNLEHLTFRLAEMDGYLSIMLGLQQSSLETRHLTCEKALAACRPLERMQRVHYMTQERIIRCSSLKDCNLAETSEIDRMLRTAAAEMPPQWWLIPDFMPDENNAKKIMDDMVRVMSQFGHYHLLMRLHLPYLLSSDHRHDYSKFVAVNTSREVLNRFLNFRKANPAHYYCRGSDFLAFIAATILCVAHINHGRKIPDGASCQSSRFEFLAHSRPSDRGLMESTMDIIKTMYDPSHDAIASRISLILRDLLNIELQASSGKLYSAKSSEGVNEDLECDGKLINGGNTMRIRIPNFGSIDFIGSTIEKTLTAPQTTAADDSSLPTTAQTSCDQIVNATGVEATEYEVPDQLPSTSDVEQFSQQISIDASLSVGNNLDQQSQGDFSWALNDDWNLQGVDIALFDGLFSGIAQDENPSDMR